MSSLMNIPLLSGLATSAVPGRAAVAVVIALAALVVLVTGTPETGVVRAQQFTDDCSNGVVIPGPANSPELVADCAILLEVKDTLAGDATLDWSANLNIAEWQGLHVDGVDGGPVRVLGIDVQQTGLTGSIPPGLGDLDALTELRLNWNVLKGEIPGELGKLNTLRVLDLSINELEGGLPDALADLEGLRHLDLSRSGISIGTLPTWLADLSDLSAMDLAEIGLVGPIPDWLATMEQLQTLHLWGNQLTGTIPAELSRLAKLEYLSLSSNHLTGTIPAELGGLTNLVYLALGANQLTGPLPEELGNLKKLVTLSLGPIDMNPEGIPAWVYDLSDLESLIMWDSGLDGPLPSGLLKLEKLRILSLANNRISGPLPPWLGNLGNLESIVLMGNQLTGPIPSELSNLTKLNRMWLDDNQLSGEIPTWLGDMVAFYVISLPGNQFSGTIPSDLGDLSNLSTLDLSDNSLSGTIPPDLGELGRLRRLDLSGNSLSGSIAAEFGQLAELYELSLNDNWLTGTIPPQLSDLALLETLNLSNNLLSGAIPLELGSLPNLKSLYLFDNMLTGTIPKALTDLVSLKVLYLGGNEFGGCVPVGLHADTNDLSDLKLPKCDAPLFVADEVKLLAPDGQPGERFGLPVAVTDDVIVIGAFLRPRVNAQTGATSTGAVLVYSRGEDGRVEETAPAVLTPPASHKATGFGRSLAVHGDTIVIGSQFRDYDRDPENVYVFTKPDGGWASMSNPAVLSEADFESTGRFGVSVAVEGETIVVGSDKGRTRNDAGSTYVFTRPPTGWTSTTTAAAVRLTPPANRGSSEYFGFTVALRGGRIAVGSLFDDTEEVNSGAVFVFTRPDGGWMSTSTSVFLTSPDDNTQHHHFGTAIAIGQSYMAVGTPNADGREQFTGVVYVYDLSDGGGVATSTVRKLFAPDGREGDRFTVTSIAIDEERLVVGANGSDHQGDVDVGTAYIFERTDKEWQSLEPLFSVAQVWASDGAAGDRFGYSIAIRDDTVVVGAIGDDDLGSDSGSAYIITLREPNGQPTFSEGSETERTISEGATRGISVGMPIGAMDPEGDSVRYALHYSHEPENEFNEAFSFDSQTGQFSVTSTAALDFETKSTYTVTLYTTDGKDESGTVVTGEPPIGDQIVVTIRLTDVPPPAQLGSPTVTSAGQTSLAVSWSALEDNIGIPVTDYDVRYRAGTAGSFVDAGYDGTGRSTTITRLSAGTSYEVQVRAGNDEGVGQWSDSGVGVTDSAPAPDPGGTSSPRRTSEPTPTPVPTVVVPEEEIVPVPTVGPVEDELGTQVVVVVQPDVATEVASPDGGATLSLPAASRATTFQTRLDTSVDNCAGEGAPEGVVQACVSVEIFDAAARRESKVTLLKPARLQVRIGSDRVETLGGPAVLVQAHLLGGVKLLAREGPGDMWREIRFALDLEPDGSAVVIVGHIRGFSEFAVVVDETVLAQAKAQVSGAPAIATPALPAVATATPAAVPSVVPTQVAPTPDAPPTGDTRTPGILLLLAALAGGLLAAIGLLVRRELSGLRG